MTTISPTNLRPPVQVSSTLWLSILQPATLLSALVNNAAIARGARTIAYDTGGGSATGYGVISTAVTNGNNADIGTALLLEVETATGVEVVRIKSITGDQTSGTITVAENGIVWGNNFPITVKHFYQIAPVPPAIRSGVFYKDYNISFQTTFATQANPVAIIGQHYAGFLSAGTIAFSLSASGSYAVASGAAISSYAWACVHNGGGTAGVSFSSTTSATPTLTITQADTYWLSLTVTDDNGKKQTTYRLVFVYDTNNQPYKDFTLSNFSGDWESGDWQLGLNITGDMTLDDIPDGTFTMLWYQNYFDGVEGYVNLWSPHGNNIVRWGYLWTDNDQDNWGSVDDMGGRGVAAFQVIGPLAYLDAITDYGTVSLEAKTNPLIWSDYASTLTVGRGIHHLLKWDTTLLDVCDVYGLTSNTWGVKVLEFTEDTVLQRIQGVAFQRGINAKLVSDRLGRLHLVRDSQMLNTAARAALDTVFSITTNDISGGVNVTRNQEDIRAFADTDGFTYSHPTSSPFISMIPGYIESSTSYNLPELRGVGSASDKQQVLNPSGGQTDCNERVGRRLALENVSPREIRFATRGNYLGAFDIVPSIGWYEWGVADVALKRELPLNGLLTVCRSVTHSPIYGEGGAFTGLFQTTEVVLQPEAQGPDGIPGNYPTTYPTIKTATPNNIFSQGEAPFIMVWNDITAGDLKAAVGTLGSISVGTPVTVLGNYGIAPTVVALSASKAVIIYVDDADSDKGKARVASVSGSTITLGSVVTFEASATGQNGAAALSSSKVILTYNTATQAKAVILDISGTTITVGTAVVMETVAAGQHTVGKLTATKAIASYASSLITPRACVLDVSGSTITANSPLAYDSNAVYGACLTAMDTETALVVFGLGGELYAIVISDITTTFNASGRRNVNLTAGVFEADVGWQHKILNRVTSTQAIAVYLNHAVDPREVTAQLINLLDSQQISVSDPVSLASFTEFFADSPNPASGVNTSRVYIFYPDGAPDGKAMTALNTGSTILSNNDAVTVSSSDTYDVALAVLQKVA